MRHAWQERNSDYLRNTYTEVRPNYNTNLAYYNHRSELLKHLFKNALKQHSTEQVSLAVSLQIRIQEKIGLNLGRDVDYSDWGLFVVFLSHSILHSTLYPPPHELSISLNLPWRPPLSTCRIIDPIWLFIIYCHYLWVTIDGVCIGLFDLLTSDSHHTKLEVITALPLISIL